MRILLPAAATLLFCMGASAQSYSYEPNTYRHGGTYSTVPSGSEQSCAETCRADTKCLVWSFRKPNTAAGSSQCELKQSIGHSEENALMISGVSPRFSEQQQAAPRPDPSDLLGGTRVSHSRRNVSRTGTHIPALTPARTATPQRRTIATPNHTSGRVLNPNDPRIIRNRTGQTSVTASSGAGQARQTRSPVRNATPPQSAPRQTQPTPQPAQNATRPYDNLRNREFPRYSVQENSLFEDEIPIDDIVDAGEAASGAGS